MLLNPSSFKYIKFCRILKSGADMENEQVETVIKDYVNLYYIIDKYDIALYKKIIAGNKDLFSRFR